MTNDENCLFKAEKETKNVTFRWLRIKMGLGKQKVPLLKVKDTF